MDQDSSEVVRSADEKLFENILNLDRITIKMHLDHLLLEISDSENTEKLRLLLKKTLLEEIMKTDCVDQTFYRTCLNETRSTLENMEYGSIDTKYQCCYVGCRFQGDRHRNYVIHLRREHPNIEKVVCNFRKECKQVFAGVNDLIQHLKTNHSSKPTQHVTSRHVVIAEINIPCKCNMAKCMGLNFENTAALMTHWNTFHTNENRDCIFSGCETTFSKSSMSRNHFRLYHKQTGKMTLKSRHLLISNLPAGETDSLINVQEIPDPVPSSSEPQVGSNEAHYNEDDMVIIENEELEQLNEEYFLQYYSDFLNRLATVKYIPQKTIQEIATEYIINTKKSLEHRNKILRNSLNNLNLGQNDIEKVMKDAEDEYRFYLESLDIH